VLLCVHDDGEGIDPAIRDRIFDPFFPTREVHRGSGLGLSTVQGIVTAHQGFVELESVPSRGTCVRIGLPAGSTPAATQPEDAASRTAARAGRVLVVEDPEPVRRLAAEVLEDHGHEVATAADGREALDRLLREGDRFDVVVMGVMLPGINGWSIYTRVSARHPDLRFVFCNGHRPGRLETEFRIDLPTLEYLQKPYHPAELLAAVNGLLERNGLRMRRAGA
jgi:CheY-like chemotaxis protein